MEDLSYESLWQAVYKEKKTNEIQTIPKTFYDDIEKYIEKLGKGENEETSETKQNAIKLLEGLFEKRKQKILIYIAHNKSLPQPMPPAEQKFYELVSEDCNKTTLDGYKSSTEQKITSLRVNKDIPEIILPSGKKIGPYKAGDKVNTDNMEDISFLKSTEICIDGQER